MAKKSSAPKLEHVPTSPGDWLLSSAKAVKGMNFAIGVVGAVAAAALCYGFFWRDGTAAVFGGIAVFLGMVALLILNSVPPSLRTEDARRPLRAFMWLCVVSAAALAAIGIAKIAIVTFPTNGSQALDDAPESPQSSSNTTSADAKSSMSASNASESSHMTSAVIPMPMEQSQSKPSAPVTPHTAFDVHDEHEDEQGETTTKGYYRFFRQDADLKLEVDFSVKQTGVTGTGRGSMVVAILDSNYDVLYSFEKGFTVGAVFPKGVAKEPFHQTITIGKEAAKKIERNGAYIVFSLQSGTASLDTPNPKRFQELFHDVIASIKSGSPEEKGGWWMKSIR